MTGWEALFVPVPLHFPSIYPCSVLLLWVGWGSMRRDLQVQECSWRIYYVCRVDRCRRRRCAMLSMALGLPPNASLSGGRHSGTAGPGPSWWWGGGNLYVCPHGAPALSGFAPTPSEIRVPICWRLNPQRAGAGDVTPLPRYWSVMGQWAIVVVTPAWSAPRGGRGGGAAFWGTPGGREVNCVAVRAFRLSAARLGPSCATPRPRPATPARRDVSG